MLIFPMPEQIKALREMLGESPEEASHAVFTTSEIWESWEMEIRSPGHLHMPAVAWNLYILHCTDKGIKGLPPI